MKKITFIDLDDTIIRGINSTYNFIEWYLRCRYGVLGYIRVKIAVVMIRVMSRLIKNPYFFRKIYLIFTLFGESHFTILYYATLWIKLLVKARAVNINVINIIKKLRSEGHNLVLLTASIDPIASIIRKILAFNDYLSTKLKVYRGIVVGVGIDLYGHLKFAVALERFCKDVFNAKYIADKWSTKIEHAHLFVKEVIVVE